MNRTAQQQGKTAMKAPDIFTMKTPDIFTVTDDEFDAGRAEDGPRPLVCLGEVVGVEGVPVGGEPK